jgi:uncharacterized membrane protein
VSFTIAFRMAGSNTNTSMCYPEFLDTVAVSEIVIIISIVIVTRISLLHWLFIGLYVH